MASSCTATFTAKQTIDGNEQFMIKFSFTAHTDGSFTSVSTDDYSHEGQTLTWWVKGKSCDMGRVNPGSTAPTAGWDITVTDADSIDIFGGELLDQDDADSKQAVPLIGSAYGPRWVNSALTLNITNNSVNSATGDIYLHFVD